MVFKVGVEPTYYFHYALTVSKTVPLLERFRKMVGQVGVEPTFVQLCTNRLEGAAITNP